MKRATIRDIDQTRFRKQPKALDENEYYNDLSIQAKYLYGIMLDKFNLSKGNGWINEKNEVYFKFRQKDLGELMNTSVRQIRRYIDELIEYDLLEKEKQISGNIYYISLIFSHRTNMSGRPDKDVPSTGQDRPIINETKYNETEYNKTHTSKVCENNELLVKKIIDKSHKTLTKKDIQTILIATNCNLETIFQKITIASKIDNKINNIVSWIISAIKNDYQMPKDFGSNQKKNDFHNFKYRGKDYSEEELEKMLGIKES
jgi:hypothetical protein